MNQTFLRLKAQKKLSQELHEVRCDLISLGILPGERQMTMPKGLVPCDMASRLPPNFGEWTDPVICHYGAHDVRVLEKLLLQVQDFCRSGYLPEDVRHVLQKRISALKGE